MKSRALLLLLPVLFVAGVVFHFSSRPALPAPSSAPVAVALAAPAPQPTMQAAAPKSDATPPPVGAANEAAKPAARPLNPAFFFGVDRPVILADIPAGPFRASLEALSPADRAAALKHLGDIHVPRAQITTLRATALGGLIHICPGVKEVAAAALPDPELLAPPPGAQAGAPVGASVPIANPPALSSKPGSTNVLYLDFNGATVTGTAWNVGTGSRSRYDAKPYDTDGDLTTFNDAEQAVIREVWARVAEDYAPFDINVTTVEPATFTSTTGHVVITQARDANGYYVPGGDGYGGVAYLGVFGGSSYVSTYSPAWVIADNLGSTNAANIAEATSHEFGHNLGLSHDGTTSLEYYGGHGSGATSWGPIMGASYGRNVTTFSKGEYYNAQTKNSDRSFEDDLAIVSSHLTYRADDTGDTNATAGDLGGAGTVTTGIIETNTDADRFRVTTGTGRIIISVSVFSAASNTRGNNLDLQAELLDETGNTVASYSPAASPDIDIDATFAPGVYYLRLSPTGVGSPLSNPPTGYTVYGSIGTYSILNNTSPVPPPAILTQPVGAAQPLGSSYTFTVVADDTATAYQWRRNGVAITGATGASLTLNKITFGQAGTYTCAVSNSAATAISQGAALAVYRDTPQTYTVNPGSDASFPQLVAGSFDDLAWDRDGTTLVDGADVRIFPAGATLRIKGILASDAGVYTLSATFNGLPVAIGPVTLAVRPPVILGVSSPVTAYRGDIPAVSITSSHNNLVYRYTGLPSGIGYVPATGALTIGTPGTTPGSYPITVYGTDPYGNTGSTSFTLVIQARTLAISVPSTLPGYTNVGPAIAPVVDATVAGYTYTGLPAGFSYNAATGAISASAPYPAAGAYPVRLTVRDIYGNTGSVDFTLDLSALPSSRTPAVVGLVDRAAMNQNLGGLLTLTPVLVNNIPTGAYTGSLNLAGLRYAVAGRVATGSPGADMTLALTASSTTKQTVSLTLTLPVDPDAAITGLVQTRTDSTAISAWTAPYATTQPATAYVGRHRFALFPPDPAPEGAPAGIGFGNVTITAPGLASWSVALADGTRVTGALPLGRDGQVAVYAAPLAPGGSLHGPLTIDSANHTLDGTLTWNRSAATGTAYAKATLYRDGFGPLALTASGGLLVPPASGVRVLGLPASSPNARLVVLDGGLSDAQATQLAQTPVTVTSTNTVLKLASGQNPAGLTLSLKAADGTFSGAFTLRDPDPLKPGATITRKVAFQGVLLDDYGFGYFLVPGLRTSTTGTPATLSGAVVLEAVSDN